MVVVVAKSAIIILLLHKPCEPAFSTVPSVMPPVRKRSIGEAGQLHSADSDKPYPPPDEFVNADATQPLSKKRAPLSSRTGQACDRCKVRHNNTGGGSTDAWPVTENLSCTEISRPNCLVVAAARRPGMSTGISLCATIPFANTY